VLLIGVGNTVGVAQPHAAA